MIPELTTERLVMRAWEDADADDLLAIMSRLEVVQWLGDQGPQIMADADQARRTIKRFNELSVDPPLAFWALRERSQPRVVGAVLLATLGDSAEVEVAYALHPDAWGKGLATEAARALVDYGLGAGLPRIWGITHPGNDASMAVLRKVGLHYQGLRPNEWYQGEWETFCTEREQPSGP